MGDLLNHNRTQTSSHMRTGGICKLACKFRDKRLTAYTSNQVLNHYRMQGQEMAEPTNEGRGGGLGGSDEEGRGDVMGDGVGRGLLPPDAEPLGGGLGRDWGGLGLENCRHSIVAITQTILRDNPASCSGITNAVCAAQEYCIRRAFRPEGCMHTADTGSGDLTCMLP